MLFDTHAHINFRAYKDDAEEVIKRTLEKSAGFIVVGTQYSTSKRAVEYAKKYPGKIFAAIGIHPIHLKAGIMEYQDSEELEPVEIKTRGEVFEAEKYLALAKAKEVVAIGEVGLDYHHFEEGDDEEKMKAEQKEVFLEFIKIANALKKPLIIHCWDAYDDLYEILKNHPVKKAGVVHSFVGGYKTARKFIELGYKIGLNGIITYSDSYDRLIREIDIKDMVLETDCPYLTPVPHKGERNEPLYVKLVAEKIALAKNMDVSEVEKITLANAKKLFSI